jgi:hypothetical protein
MSRPRPLQAKSRVIRECKRIIDAVEGRNDRDRAIGEWAPFGLRRKPPLQP